MTNLEDSAAVDIAEENAIPEGAEKVSVKSVVMLGLAGQQIIPSALIGAAYLPLESGNGAWLSMLLAMVATLCVMSAVNIFARRYVVTGSIMSYCGLAFGRGVERLVASSYLIGFLVAGAAVTASTVMFASSFLQSLGMESAGSGWFQAIASILVVIAAGGIAWRGLDASISLTAWLAFLAFPPLALAIGFAVMNVGLDVRSQLTLTSTDWPSIIRGTIVGLAYFVGIDALASLAAETENPKKNVPVILNSVLLITGGAYVFLLLIATPLMNNYSDQLNEGVSPTAIITKVAGLEQLQTPIDLLLIGATFASLVAFINYGSRVFATASHTHFLPPVFARIHPRFGSPTGATILMAAASAAVPVCLQVFAASPPLQSTAYLSTLYSMFWVVPYILLSFAAVRVILREGLSSPVQAAVVVVGMSAFIFLAYDSFFHPADGVIGVLPYVTLVVMICGYALFTLNESVQKRSATLNR